MRGPKRPSSSTGARSRTRGSSSRTSAEGDALASLRRLYAKVDATLAGWTCAASTDCCRFGVTGREPYPTAVEIAELERAVRARGGLPKRRVLPVLPVVGAGTRGERRADDERRCTLLGDDGRCLVYASRPFGCRTFFCERASGPVGERADADLPRAAISEIARDIAALSATFAPTDPAPRPLSRVTRAWEADRSRR